MWGDPKIIREWSKANGSLFGCKTKTMGQWDKASLPAQQLSIGDVSTSDEIGGVEVVATMGGSV